MLKVIDSHTYEKKGKKIVFDHCKLIAVFD